MAKIYALANHVVVWLGEEADDSSEALEDIRIAGDAEKASNSSNPEIIQQSVLALLRHPWFRRVWILQEIAAARHVLILCGPVEIDGYAFWLGVDSLKLYGADPNLQNSIDSIAYLIKGTIFRTGYITDLGRSSLGICPLGQLMDMYHAHEATQLHDKVYALLGMSTDDFNEASLSPSYRVSWEEVFQNLIRFLLYSEISVEALGHKQTALMKSKGSILGTVSLLRDDITRNNSQSKEVEFTHRPSSIQEPYWCTKWTLHHSAKSVQDGDVVCILPGASRPIIIRLCCDHFDIIMIAASPPKKILDLSQTIKTFPHDLVLIWDWGKPPEKLRNGGTCGASIRGNSWSSEHLKTESEGYLEESTRLWNAAIILEASNKPAEKVLEELIEHYGIAAKRGYGKTLKQQLETRLIDINAKDETGRTALSWAAGEGHEAALKLLVETGQADIDAADTVGRTALAWGAWKGHEGVVRLLIETGEVKINSKDVNGGTPLFWAIHGTQKGIVKLILQTGEAEVDAKDIHGDTALTLATASHYESIVEVLLERGNPLEKPRRLRRKLSSLAESSLCDYIQVIVDLPRRYLT